MRSLNEAANESINLAQVVSAQFKLPGPKMVVDPNAINQPDRPLIVARKRKAWTDFQPGACTLAQQLAYIFPEQGRFVVCRMATDHSWQELRSVTSLPALAAQIHDVEAQQDTQDTYFWTQAGEPGGKGRAASAARMAGSIYFDSDSIAESVVIDGQAVWCKPGPKVGEAADDDPQARVLDPSKVVTIDQIQAARAAGELIRVESGQWYGGMNAAIEHVDYFLDRVFDGKVTVKDILLLQSGAGLHGYLGLAEAIPTEKWCELARLFADLAISFGLSLDWNVTQDPARVLRPVQSVNRKRAVQRPVRAMTSPASWKRLSFNYLQVTLCQRHESVSVAGQLRVAPISTNTNTRANKKRPNLDDSGLIIPEGLSELAALAADAPTLLLGCSFSASDVLRWAALLTRENIRAFYALEGRVLPDDADHSTWRDIWTKFSWSIMAAEREGCLDAQQRAEAEKLFDDALGGDQSRNATWRASTANRPQIGPGELKRIGAWLDNREGYAARGSTEGAIASANVGASKDGAIVDAVPPTTMDHLQAAADFVTHEVLLKFAREKDAEVSDDEAAITYIVAPLQSLAKRQRDDTQQVEAVCLEVLGRLPGFDTDKCARYWAHDRPSRRTVASFFALAKAGGYEPERHAAKARTVHFAEAMAAMDRRYVRSRLDTAPVIIDERENPPAILSHSAFLLDNPRAIEFTGASGKLMQKPRGKAWLENHDHRHAERAGFEPGAPARPDFYNLFRDWKIEPREGDVSAFNAVCEALADDRTDEFRFLKQYPSHMFRQPEEKPSLIAFIWSPETGTGKGGYADSIGKVAAPYYEPHFNVQSLLTGAANVHLLQKMWLVGDETCTGGQRWDRRSEIAEALKHFVQSATMPIKKLYADSTNAPSFQRIIILSNFEDAIPIESHDRRVCMLRASDRYADDKPGAEKFWKRYYKWLREGGLHALMHHFLYEVDLTGFNPHSSIKTQAMIQARLRNLNPIERAFRDLLCTGAPWTRPNGIPINDGEAAILQPTMTTSASLTLLANAGRRSHEEFSREDVAAAARRLFNLDKAMPLTIPGAFGRPRGWNLPPRAEARRLFAAATRTPDHWDCD